MNGPGVADGKAPRMIPFVGSRGIGICRDPAPLVINHIGANKQGLIAGKIEIHLGRVRVQTDWRAGVESESANVHSVADGGVIGRILCRCP